MKFMDKRTRCFALALGLAVIGGTPSAFAQDQRQDNRQQQEMNQDRQQDEMNYEELFGDVDQTDQHDVLELLGKDENFSIFMELLEKSGVEASLKHVDQSVTIFAPTNDAFKELSASDYKELMETEDKAMLNRIVGAHILPQEVSMGDFETNQIITSAEGDEIAVETVGVQGAAAQGPGSVIIGGAAIVRPDIQASNGTIHVVNNVIMAGETNDPRGFGVYR